MEKFKSFVKKSKLGFSLLAEIKEPADNPIQTNKYLVFSGEKMSVYSTDFRILKTYHLFTLSKAEFVSHSFFLTFSVSKFSFQSRNSESIKNYILDLMPTVMSNAELHQVGMEPFHSFVSNPSLKSIIQRIKGRAELLNILNIDDILEKLNRIILFQESKVVFREFKNLKNAFPLVLDVLPLCPFITSIVVVSFDNYDPFDLLTDFAAKNSTIEYFRIEGPLSSRFDRFIHALQSNTDKKILGLTFDGSHFNSAAIRSLASCISSKSIPSIGFRNAIRPDTVNTFYNFFLPGPVGNQLKFLCIDSTPSVKISTMISKLVVLSVLSVTNCGLNIAKVLPTLSTTRLRTLDLSGNTCTTSLMESDFGPPSTLVHLLLNDITWGNSTFSGFFKYLEKFFKGPLKLSLAQSEAPTEEWIKLYLVFKSSKFANLRELIWDNNPVHRRLFTFLRKNTKLHNLSMSGCFHETEPEPILYLTTYLFSAKSLTKLILSSNENAYLGKFSASIFAAVQACNNLEYLDISNSKCGDTGITQLKFLLKNTSLKTLHCDGTNPQSSSNFLDFIETVKEFKKQKKFQFYFPKNDFNVLLNSKRLKLQKYNSIRNSMTENDYLYHGECVLEFTELVKNLTSLKQELTPIKDAKIPKSVSGNLDSFSTIPIHLIKSPGKNSKEKFPGNSSTELFTLESMEITQNTLDLPKTVEAKSKKLPHKSRTKRHSFRHQISPPNSDSGSDFIFGTDVLDGKDNRSIESLESSPHRASPAVIPAPPLEIVPNKLSMTPDWSFPFQQSNFINIDFKWTLTEDKYNIERLSTDLRHTQTQPHPK